MSQVPVTSKTSLVYRMRFLFDMCGHVHSRSLEVSTRLGQLHMAQEGIVAGMDRLGCCAAWRPSRRPGSFPILPGIHHLPWVAAIAVFVLAEKLAPRGEAFGRVTGVVLALSGLFFLSRTI